MSNNQFEYNAPTALTGAFNHVDNGVDLAWVAPTLNNKIVFATPGSFTFLTIQGFQTFTATAPFAKSWLS